MQKQILQIGAAGVGHLIGVAVVATALLWVAIGPAVGPVASAVWRGDVGNSAAPEVALHLLIAAVVWVGIVIVFRRAFPRERRDSPRFIRLESGTALTEFLIILVPFLALTSGLSQLAILNTAGLLADVAIFNASRATWVWDARDDSTASYTRFKARTAAALALAPTAPSDFHVDQVASAPLRDFVDELGGDGGALGGSQTTFGEDLFYNIAYDTGAFSERITKKVYFAYLATSVDFEHTEMVTPENRTVPAITTEFEYKMNVVFPWFAYIWGQRDEVAGRTGYYSTIRRKETLPRQLQAVPQ